MKKTNGFLRTLIVIAGLLPLIGIRADAGNIKIIANPSVKADSISPAELRSVFLEESTELSDGSHVEPVISKGGAAHAAFIRDFLGKTDSDLLNYYRSLVFTGKGSMPKSEGSDSEIAAYVAKTRGAIGYVSIETSADGVKILSIQAMESHESRRLITRVEPIYPAALQANHIGGVVRLEVVIAANGSVESVEVRGGNPILGEAATAAVKKWVYAPRASKTKTEVTIPFGAEN